MSHAQFHPPLRPHLPPPLAPPPMASPLQPLAPHPPPGALHHLLGEEWRRSLERSTQERHHLNSGQCPTIPLALPLACPLTYHHQPFFCSIGIQSSTFLLCNTYSLVRHNRLKTSVNLFPFVMYLKVEFRALILSFKF